MRQIADIRDHAFRRVDLETILRDDDPRVIAGEMQRAFWRLADAVLSPLIVEAIVARGGDGRPPPAHPYWLLRRDELPPSLDPAWVESQGMSGALRRSAHAISPPNMAAWIDEAFALSGSTNLEHLTVVASCARVPPPWATGGVLQAESPSGRLALPTTSDGGATWLPPPPSRLVLRQPVELAVGCTGHACSIALAIYWSPWVEELDRAGRPLNLAIESLVTQGWRITDDGG